MHPASESQSASSPVRSQPLARSPGGRMNEISYDVKIWNIETRRWKSKTSYRVTWFVAGERFDEKANTYALADSFRSDLIAAARRGEAFHRVRGLPVSK